MKTWLWNRLTIIVVVLFGAAGLACAEAARPPGVRHVLVISVDGLRPDVLLRADAPNIRGLMDRGSFSMWARTIESANTLPSHTSMMTGVISEKHGITFNSERQEAERVYPSVPTLFQLAKKKGLTTAMASGKGKFNIFDKDGSLDSQFIAQTNGDDDRATAQEAAKIIREKKPQVMLLHLAGVDAASHREGWGTPASLAAAGRADEGVGIALAALKEAGLTDSTIVILTADHGGSGKNHGRGDERSRYIPWIAAGPGVRKNYDLTNFRELDIDTMDTFATACFVMGIPLPANIDGKPVEQILESHELPKDAAAPKPAGAKAPAAGARR